MYEVSTSDVLSGMTVIMTYYLTVDRRSPKLRDKPPPGRKASSKKPYHRKFTQDHDFTPNILLKGILFFAFTISTYQRVPEVRLENFEVEKCAALTPIRESNVKPSSQPSSKFMSDWWNGCKYATNVRMKPQVWSKLPTDLLLTIIAKLPLQGILQLRSVCREWRALACNHSCLDSSFALSSRVETSTASCPPIYICLLQNNQWGVYNPTSNAWSVLPHSFIPKYYPVSPFHRIPIASVGSILLLRGVEHGSRVFFVVNPVNKSERKLPALPQPRPDVLKNIGLIALLESSAWIVESKETGDFRVVSDEEYIVDHPVEPYKIIHFLSVYDSRTDSWTLKWALVPDLQSKCIRQVVMLRDQLLCLVELPQFRFALLNLSSFEEHRVSDDGGQQWNTCMNLEYKMRFELWPHAIYIVQQKGSEKGFFNLPHNISGAQLFEWGGCLMLVTKPGKMLYQGKSIMMTMQILQFSPERYEWVRFQTMPMELLDHVSSGELIHQVSAGDPKFKYVDDSLHYSIQINGTYIALSNFYTGKTAMCNVSTGIWWLLPPKSTEVLKALPDQETQRCTFLLKPSLEIV